MTKVKFSQTEHVAQITIDSPPANALSSTIIREIDSFLDEIEQDSSVKAVVLHGEGRFFSAGADIKEFTDIKDPKQFSRLSADGQKTFARIESFHIPVIAAIHGAALGGGLELAMSCHMRIVSEQAKLGLPELTLGIIPGFAGTQRLPQLVGAPKAYEMMLTSEPIDGHEAVSLGIANKAVPEVSVLDEALKIANNIASKSKPTIEKTLELISYAKAGEFTKGAEEEANSFGKLFGTKDAQEGINAFLEKRKPNFTDQ